MKKVVYTAVAVLALTTGFTCSKKAPVQAAPEVSAPAEQAQMAAPVSGDMAPAAPAEAAPVSGTH